MVRDPAHTRTAALRLSRLTSREREVVVLVGGGCMGYRDVARTMSITENTLRDKIDAVCRKLEFGTGRPKELIIRFYHSHHELLEA